MTDLGVFEAARATTMQGDGKIVVAGSSDSSSTDTEFALARYNENGSLDETFSQDGKLTTNVGGGNEAGALALALQADGKIVVAGTSVLARYNADGSLDASFGVEGRQPTQNGRNTRLALQDGKIVVAGVVGNPNGDDFALARYNPDGSLDASFGVDGKQSTDFGGNDSGGAVSIQADAEKIVVAGASDDDVAVARYDRNGALDPTFSADGREKTVLWGQEDTSSDLSLQPDGKVVVVGRSYSFTSGSNTGLVLRYNPDGSLDEGFSGDGMDFASSLEGGASAGALQSNGKIVAAGESFSLVRYNADGSLDSSFADRWHTDFGGSAEAFDMALQPDGKIVAAGGADGDAGSGDFALARYEGGDPEATPPPDTTAPETSITSGPSGTVRSTSASFGLASSEGGSTFECRLDGGTWSACTSPEDYSSLGQGIHTFEAAATDAAGNRDSTPATQSWTVDTVAPEVTTVSPSPGATGISPTADVLATFSEDMRASTITGTTVELVPKGGTTAVTATVTYDSSLKRAKLDPSNSLKRGATYIATVTTGVEDLAGNPMASNKSWSFTVKR